MAVLLLAAAAFLLVVNRRHQSLNPLAVRGLAVFLLVQGATTLFAGFMASAVDHGDSVTAISWARVAVGAALLRDLPALFFMIAFLRPGSWWVAPWGTTLFVAVAVLIEVLFFMDPTRFDTLVPRADGGFTVTAQGWLGLVRIVPAIIIIAIIFTLFALRASTAEIQTSYAVAAFAFGLTAWTGIVRAVLQAFYGTTTLWTFSAASDWLETTYVITRWFEAALTLLWLGFWIRLGVQAKRPGTRFGVALCLALGIVFAIGQFFTASMPITQPLRVLFSVIPAVFLPILICVALLRHQLFGFRVEVHRAVKASALGALFLVLLLATAEIAQQFLTDSFGLVAGGLVAGLVLLGIRPLQRWAERLADAAIPHAKPFGEMDQPERGQLYGEMVQAAWQDGSMTLKERKLLNVARDRLGLTVEEATRLENRAIALVSSSGPAASA